MSLVFPNATPVKLVSMNARSEDHGPDLVPAIDLRFSTEMSSARLSLLHPELRALLYEESKQGELLDPDDQRDGGELRFPELKAPFVWKEEQLGYNLVIDYGLGGPGSDIALGDGKLHKIAFEPKEGGTCTVLFTVSCTHNLTAEAVGHLGLRVKHPMHITLVQPPPQDGTD